MNLTLFKPLSMPLLVLLVFIGVLAVTLCNFLFLGSECHLVRLFFLSVALVHLCQNRFVDLLNPVQLLDRCLIQIVEGALGLPAEQVEVHLCETLLEHVNLFVLFLPEQI